MVFLAYVAPPYLMHCFELRFRQWRTNGGHLRGQVGPGSDVQGRPHHGRRQR